MTYQLPANSSRENFLFLKDHRIWWLALVGLIGLIIYLRFDSRVFPTASLELKLTRNQITQEARGWASKLDYQKNHIIESTEFAPNNDAKTFLEYEFGAEEANKLMRDTLPIWSWHSRFCREYDFEEFETWLSPAGKIQSFFHKLKNDTALPKISKDEAEAISRKFIETNLQIPLSDYKMIKSWSYSHPHRVDNSFTWEDQKADYKGSRLRIQTTVSGNMLTQCSYFLYVPEAWERKFSTIRSYNTLYETIATIFYQLIQFSAVFIFLWAIPSNNLRWRFSLIAAGIVTIIGALDSFNDIAAIISDYDTSKPYVSYIRSFVIQTLVGMMGSFINSLTLIGAGEAVYRLTYPKRVAFENFFSKGGLRSKTVLNCLVIAHVLLAIDLGWVVFYYLVGERFHFWCPLGVDSFQILTNIFPFFSAIAIGVSASVTEELMYRIICLAAVQRLTKSFWIANLFQAAAWGFMHSTYPQQPAYARGVELTLGGMLHGWILSRYGILPSLVSHYLFDALLDAKPLLNSGEPLLRISALLPIIPFLLLAIWIASRIRKNGAIEETEIENAAITEASKVEAKQPEEPLVSAQVSKHKQLARSQRFILLIVAIASMSAALIFRNYPAIGATEHIVISRLQAAAKAVEIMKSRGYLSPGMRAVTSLEEESYALDLQYVFEQVKLNKTLEMAKVAKQGFMWKTRFFKPLDPDEYEVVLDKSGNEIALAITKAEDDEGANLSEDVARKKAEDYLNRAHAVFAPYEYSSSTVEHLKHRTDYSFTFIVPKMKAGEADLKVYTSVIGDQVSGFSASWEYPESWKQERDKRTIIDEIYKYAYWIISTLLIIVTLRWTFTALKSGKVEWRLGAITAIPLVLMTVLDYFNLIPQLFASYANTEPINSFLIKSFSTDLSGILSTYAYYFISTAFAVAALHLMAPSLRLSSFFRVAFLAKTREEKTERCLIWMDSLLIVSAYIALHLLLNALTSWGRMKMSPDVPTDSLSTICSLGNLYSPAYDIFHDAVTSGFYELLLVAVGASLYKKYCRNFWYFAGGFTLLSMITFAHTDRYWQNYVFDVLSAVLYSLLCWFVVRKLGTYNPLVYFFAGAGELLLSRLFTLVDHGEPLFFSQLMFVYFLLAAPFIWLLILFIAAGRGEQKKSENVVLTE